MTRDDIIRMAREAGIEIDAWEPLYEGDSEGFRVCEFTHEELERFAALVAAAEREACAQAARTAMLGVDWVLTERVLKAIRKRGEKE